MKDTDMHSESHPLFSDEDTRFAKLMMEAIGDEGLQNIANYTFTDIEKSEPLQIEVIEHFECGRCGKCCNVCDAELADDDIVRICKHLKIGFDEFYDRFMDHTHINNYLVHPCPFLKDNECTIYAVRPHVCKQYPFADNTMTVHPCKIGEEIWKTLVKAVDKVVPTEQDEKDIAVASRAREFIIASGRDNNVCHDHDKCDYVFVGKNNLVTLLKYLRRQEHHKKEALAHNRGI